ncbi:CBS domain-containing protein [Methylomagnum sp.]
MHTKVFTVEEDALIERVFFLMHYEKIRHVPVINRKSEVIGIVSDRDLYKALGPKTNSNVIEESNDKASLHVVPQKVRHIMHRAVVTINPNEYATDAAAIMAKHRIGALPVVKDGKLAGIITATDLLRFFSRHKSSEHDAAAEQASA